MDSFGNKNLISAKLKKEKKGVVAICLDGWNHLSESLLITKTQDFMDLPS